MVKRYFFIEVLNGGSNPPGPTMERETPRQRKDKAIIEKIDKALRENETGMAGLFRPKSRPTIFKDPFGLTTNPHRGE